MKRSQGMTEYIIIVGLIAILLITAVKAFKASVQGGFDAGTEKIQTDVTNSISGEYRWGADGDGPGPDGYFNPNNPGE